VRRPPQRSTLAVVAFVALFLLDGAAVADKWLPHPADATWTYEWTDTVYNRSPTRERVTVKERQGRTFTLSWTTEGQGNAPEAVVSIGTVTFQETSAGLFALDWSSNAPSPSFPVLCPTVASCGNSLASAYYNLIWGSRAPVLPSPLVTRAGWTSTGGAQNDVTSTSDAVAVGRISVPAFPKPVDAVKVRSEITQAGAIGDPYGSGVRTVWWVYGVGPVRLEFAHSGGSGATVTTAVLRSTNQAPKRLPDLANYFPLQKGLHARYRWTNRRYLSTPVVERFAVDEVVNGSARISVKSISGPIRVAGAYGFTSRLDGVTNLWGITRAASLAKLPRLGPKRLPPEKRRRFFTPFDLMTFGFNPVIPAYPTRGERWTSRRGSRDYSIFGVAGKATVAGVRSVKVPAGTYRALVVRTTLRQKGFPFGSGTRTSWFAPGKGLVKLVFRHGDGSTSRVELLG
jgi:hypothetical protein